MEPRSPEALTEPELLYSDEHLLAFAKPAGLLSVPGRSRPRDEPCLSAWAAARHGRVWVVHRLDRDTSGVVVLARTPGAHRALGLAFEERRVDKLYLALVAGGPPAESGRIDLPLHPARKGKSRPARPGEPGARAASTRYRVLERLPGAAWLELVLETGRHHQARVHLRALGCPLLLDPKYGPRAPPAGVPLERTPLHAASLGLPHPDGSDRRLELRAPLPADLSRTLEALRPRGLRLPGWQVSS